MGGKKHTYLFDYDNGFYLTGSEVKQFKPFNSNEFAKPVDDSDPFFESSVYKRYVSRTKKGTMRHIPGIARGLIRLVIIDNDSPDYFGGYGYADNGDFYADYIDCTAKEYNEDLLKNFAVAKHTIIKFNHGEMMSACCVNEFGGEGVFEMTNRVKSKGRKSSSAPLFAAMAKLVCFGHDGNLSSNIAKDFYNHYLSLSKAYRERDVEMMKKALRICENDIYTIFQYPGTIRESKLGNITEIDVGKIDSDMFLPLKTADIPTGKYRGNSAFLTLTGLPKPVIDRSKAIERPKEVVKPKKKSLTTVGDYIEDGRFIIASELSADEKLEVPKDMNDLIPSKQALEVLQEIKSSYDDGTQCHNILIYGPSGTGKSTMARYIAAMTGLPYRNINLHGEKGADGLYQQLFPTGTTVSKEEYMAKVASFPDAFDVELDPVSAYEKLTGERNEKATSTDVFEMEEKIRYDMLVHTNDYMYCDTSILKTVKNGGIIEIMEANAAKAGTLKAFNELLDDTNLVHLETGEIVKRHPNCIIIFTMNIGDGYEGVNQLSVDFSSRMDITQYIDVPDDDTLLERVKFKIGYTDDDTIKKCIKVYHQMRRVLEEGTTYADRCSDRQLYSWIRTIKHTGKPYEAAIMTILNGSSYEKDVREELKSALETEFAPSI